MILSVGRRHMRTEREGGMAVTECEAEISHHILGLNGAQKSVCIHW